MIRVITITSLVAFALVTQSCRSTTEIVEIQPVVYKRTYKSAPKPAPKPRTPTPAETSVVNQYD
jgi:hypothetical protein